MIDYISEKCQDKNDPTGCLKLETNPMTWWEAWENFDDQGGDLFYLKAGEDLQEILTQQSALYSQIIATAKFFHIHIGMRRSVWQWTGRVKQGKLVPLFLK